MPAVIEIPADRQLEADNMSTYIRLCVGISACLSIFFRGCRTEPCEQCAICAGAAGGAA